MGKHAMKRTIAIVVLIGFMGLAHGWGAEQAGPSFHEQAGTPVVRKHKRFPWVLTLLGIAAIGTTIYFLTKKKSPVLPRLLYGLKL